jgi:peptidoglycan-associated lipoprotein
MKKNRVQSRWGSRVPGGFVVLGLLIHSAAGASPVRTKSKVNAAPPIEPVPITEYSDSLEADPVAVTPMESMSSPKKMAPWWLFLGADAGLSAFSTFNDSSSEASRSGLHLGVRALIARYFNKWVIDGGLGWHFLQNSATYPAGDKVKVTTRGAYLDFSARYRFPRSNWQVGPELEYWLSTDNGLNQNVFDNSSNTSLWGGLQVINDWPSDPNRFRFGGRWLTDFNVTGRSAHIFQVFFQIGFSVFGGGAKEPPRRIEQMNERDLEKASAYTPPVDPLPIATPEPTPEATPWAEPLPISTPEPTPEPTPKPIAKAKLVMTLDVNDLPFDFDSARMPRYNMDRVREIGRFLGENQAAWKSIVVSGHTDSRGSNEYNDKLSKARADTVRQLLGEGGAPLDRIKSVGYGERKPKVKGNNEKAWSQNRRVELEFKGVKDVRIIKNAFDTPKRETR